MHSNFSKNIRILATVLSIVIVLTGVAVPRRSQAFFGAVIDAAQLAVEIVERAADVIRDVDEYLVKKWGEAYKAAKHRAMQTFVNQLAYQVAVDLASKAKGQKPVFYQDSMFDYLTKAGDSAAANFIETLATQRTCVYPSQIDTTGGDPACRADCISECDGSGDQTNACIEQCVQEECSIGKVGDETGATSRHPFHGRACQSDRECPGGGECIGGFGMSICAFDPNIQFQIQAGLVTDLLGGNVQQGRCSFYEDIWKGLPNRIAEKDFNEYFVVNIPNYFKEGNTTTQYLKFFNDAVERKSLQEETARYARIEGQGFRPLTNLVGDIKTPGRLFGDTYSVSLGKLFLPKEVFGDDIIADAIGIFADTFIKSYIQIPFKGIGPDADKDTRFIGGGSGPFRAAGGSAGRSAALARFASFAQTQFQRGGDLDILNDLATCPGQFATPLNCTIDEGFREAAEEGIRLKDAAPNADQITAGATAFIPREKLFGYGEGGRALTLEEGIPYNSIVIMAHYRIVPTSWKIAAEYIRDHGLQKTVGELMDEYYDPNSVFYHLVDPEWVLKAPAQMCEREGFTNVILDEQFLDNDGVEGSPEQRIVTRQTSCVDDRSCVAEDPNTGECRAYGYCTEEEQNWKFEGEACELPYASCQSFRRGDSGEQVAYLQNTLDESGACNSNNAGCEFYCTSGEQFDPDTQTWSCRDPEDLAGVVTEGQFLDKEATECASGDVGCTRLQRTIKGANLVRNGSFELTPEGSDAYDDTPDLLSEYHFSVNGAGYLRRMEAPYNGSQSYELADGTLQYDVVYQTEEGPIDIIGKQFTLEFAVKSNGATDLRYSLHGRGATRADKTIPLSSDWQIFTLSMEIPESGSGNTVGFTIEPINGSIYLDNLHFQDGGESTGYAEYAVSHTLHMKVPPTGNAFGCTGSPSDRPECRSFAPLCSNEEVGCELYTPLNGDPVVPGIPGELCSADQVGCQLFKQKSLVGVTVGPLEPIAERLEGEFPIIPEKGQECSALDVGCEEFTNLSSENPEQREYYTRIRQCVVPGSNPSQNVRPYLSWTVADSGGYELFEERLLKTNLGSNAPCTNLSVGTDDDQLTCVDTADTVIDCTEEFGTNPDCREYHFIQDNGEIDLFYRYASLVIHESESCDPLRNTLDQQVYYVDTARSRTCAPQAASCREYSGNGAGNTQRLFYDTFAETIDPWQGGILAAETPIPNQVPPDHSMAVNGTARRLAGGSFGVGASYVVEFWAKGPGDATFSLDNGAERVYFTRSGGDPTLSLAGEWQPYTLGPLVLTSDLGVSTQLAIENVSDGDVFVDNILLREVSDSVYLVKNTLVANGAYCQEIGCEAYRDREGDTSFIQDFKKLCRDDAIGCELFIDTRNTIDPAEETFSMSQDGSISTVVPEDTFVTYVNNAQYYCREEAQGCQEVGRAIFGPETVGDTSVLAFQGYGTESRIVNAEHFDTAICTKEARSCEEFIPDVAGGQSRFFKDPNEALCTYRVPSGGGTANWFVDGVEGDVPCPVTSLVGESSDPPIRPDGEFTGACPVEQTGCSVYRDPMDPVECFSECPYVEDEDGVPVYYSLRADGTCQALENPGNRIFGVHAPGCKEYAMISQTLETSCELVGTDGVAVDPTCKLFRNSVDASTPYTADLSPSGAPFLCKDGDTIKGTCTSLSDTACTSRGYQCVQNDPIGPPVPCNSEQTNPSASDFCDSNITVRVRPDRTCSEWLACDFSEVVPDPQDIDRDGKREETQCRSIRRCVEMNPDYTCKRFADDEPQNQTASRATRDVLFTELPRTSGVDLVGMSFGCSNDRTRDCHTNSDCTGGGVCEVVEGTYPMTAMSEVGVSSAYKELIVDGTFEDNLFTGFPGRCDEHSFSTRIDQTCLSDSECGTGTIVNTENVPIPGKCIPTYTGRWTLLNAGAITIEDEPVTQELTNPSNIEDRLNGNNVLQYSADSQNPDDSDGIQYDFSLQVVEGEYVVTFTGYSPNYDGVNPVPLTVKLRGNSGNTYTIGEAQLSGSKQRHILGPAQITPVPTEPADLVFEVDGKSFVIDDLSMLPVLQYQNEHSDQSDPKYVSRECRAYPEQDSLACNYVDEKSIQHAGWSGYCLQRNPNRPEQCLTWWPVDVISGEAGLNNQPPAGYAQRRPLYYCSEGMPISTNNGDPQIASWIKEGTYERPVNYCNVDSEDECSRVLNFWSGCHWRTDYCGDNFNEPGFYSGNPGFISTDFSPSGNSLERALFKDQVRFFEMNVEHGSSGSNINDGYPGDKTQFLLGRETLRYSNSLDDPNTSSINCGNDSDNNPIPCTAWSGVVKDSDGTEDWILEFGSADFSGPDYIGLYGKDLFDSTNCPEDKSGVFNAVRVNWDPDGMLSESQPFQSSICERYNVWEDVVLQMNAVLQTACQEIVKVADVDRDYAWVERVNTGTGITDVPDLHYTYEQTGSSDELPFGSSVPPIGGGPESWDGIDFSTSYSRENDPLIVQSRSGTSSETPRAGLPFQCGVECPGGSCTGGSICPARQCQHASKREVNGQPCLTNNDCSGGICIGTSICSESLKKCVADDDCNPGGTDVCIGGRVQSVESISPFRRIPDYFQYLFANLVEKFRWDQTTRQYEKDSTYNGRAASYQFMFECAPGERDNLFGHANGIPQEYGVEGYCGIPPNVENLLVNGSTGILNVSQGTIVQLSFTGHIDPEQRPLQVIYVDWDDGTPIQPIPWGRLELSSPEAPFRFSHPYTQAGTYVPRVLLVDNWEWCTNGDGNADGYRSFERGASSSCVDPASGSWIPYNGTVVVSSD
ncbi:MAG: hypothetical protein HYZ08_00445 [Candidatus Kerfeldbacteria bacterium]|nr:hypothetical protein [Candidatus Kerfeldbacteria bacterium]